jgi:ATP-binding cassette subfamily B protein
VKLLNLPPILQHRVAKGTTRRALKFARPFRTLILVFVTIIIVDAFTASSVPLIIRGIINNGIGAHDKNLIILLAVVLGVVTLLDQAMGVVISYLSARIGQGIIFELRSVVYRHVQSLPLAFFTRTQTGSLMSRLDNDVNGAQQAFSDLLSVIVGNVFNIAIAFVVMLTLSWEISLIALVALPVGIVLARFASHRLAGFARANYQLLAELSTQMSERFNVGGALLVTLFGRPAAEAALYEGTSGKVRDLGVRMAVYSRLFTATLLTMAGLITALIFGWGGVLVSERTLTLGTVVALATYLGRLYGPLISLGNAPVDVMNALVSFERLFEVLDVSSGVRQRPDAVDIPSGPARIVVDHVDFSYPGRAGTSIQSLEPESATADSVTPQVLFDVSFVMEPGQLVALLGHTGAGKTTISYLVRHLYEVTSGRITVNGINVHDATLTSMQDCMGMVTQDVHLFHDTVRSNLLYARPDASEEELFDVLDRARLLPTIQQLPHGLDTVVGDRGFRLSGGEKQRLAIARLLLKAPAVVILDEATAHLDSETEQAVQSALLHALEGRTSLVIAHRLSTVRRADLILVLDHGRIVERGTHDELMEARGHYFDLHHSQLAP